MLSWTVSGGFWHSSSNLESDDCHFVNVLWCEYFRTAKTWSAHLYS